MEKYDIKKLIKKYNKILTEKYARYCYKYKLLKNYDDDIDSLSSLKGECWSDTCDTYKECDYLLKYVYFKYIENDIKDFMEV